MRGKLVAICLGAAVCAAGAASTASAEPEFLTKAVVGEAASSVPFTATIGVVTFEGAISHAKITCTAGSASGTVTGARSVAGVVLTLTGCETSGGKVKTNGQPEGTIVTKPLAGTLGGINATLPGLKLYSEAEGKGGILAEAQCAGLLFVTWTGEVTGSLSGAAGEGPATGKLLASLKLTFAQTAGKQKYQGFSEGPESGLMGQLTATVNGTPELNGWSWIGTLRPVPSTFGLGVTK